MDNTRRNLLIAQEAQRLLKTGADIYLVEDLGLLNIKAVVIHQTGNISVKTYLSKTFTYWKKEDLLMLARMNEMQGKIFFERLEV